MNHPIPFTDLSHLIAMFAQEVIDVVAVILVRKDGNAVEQECPLVDVRHMANVACSTANSIYHHRCRDDLDKRDVDVKLVLGRIIAILGIVGQSLVKRVRLLDVRASKGVIKAG